MLRKLWVVTVVYVFLLAAAGFAEEKTEKPLPVPTNLLLKDENFDDAALNKLVKTLPKLQRLTLRRMPNITAVPKVVTLRNLSLIEMDVTARMFDSILVMKDLVALDLRYCNGLTLEQYKCLKQMLKLRDLKIGGFAVNDEVLETIVPLPNLTGLTLDDSFITAEGLAKYIAKSPSAKTLQMVVINKGTLTDEDLLPLNKLPKLQRLTVSNAMVTGSFLGKWAADETSRPKLKRLSLRNTLLDEENAAHLKKYVELQQTDLSGTIVEATAP